MLESEPPMELLMNPSVESTECLQSKVGLRNVFHSRFLHRSTVSRKVYLRFYTIPVFSEARKAARSAPEH